MKWALNSSHAFIAILPETRLLPYLFVRIRIPSGAPPKGEMLLARRVEKIVFAGATNRSGDAQRTFLEAGFGPDGLKGRSDCSVAPYESFVAS